MWIVSNASPPQAKKSGENMSRAPGRTLFFRQQLRVVSHYIALYRVISRHIAPYHFVDMGEQPRQGMPRERVGREGAAVMLAGPELTLSPAKVTLAKLPGSTR